MCHGASRRDLHREPPATSIAMIGLDTAKMVCSQRANSA
jgi:hypothetical protein